MWNIRPLMNTIMFTFLETIRNIMKIFIPLQYRMEKISSEIALVTVDAGGLGRPLALSLVNHSAIVVIWDINQKGLIGCPVIVDYCATKYSVVGFSEVLQLELDFHGHDVTITSVCPAFIHNTGMPEAKYSGRVPTVSPQNVAESIATSIRCNRNFVLVPNYMYFVLLLKWIMPRCFYSKVLRFLMPVDPTEFYPIESQEKYKTHFSNANNVIAS